MGGWGDGDGGVKGTKARGKKQEKKPHKYSYHHRLSSGTAQRGSLDAVLVLLREHVFVAPLPPYTHTHTPGATLPSLMSGGIVV